MLRTLPPVSSDFRTARWQDTSYEYLTVREVVKILQKCPSRVYAMIGEGLLDDVGWLTFRAPNGRIWIGIPKLTPAEIEFLRVKEARIRA